MHPFRKGRNGLVDGSICRRSFQLGQDPQNKSPLFSVSDSGAPTSPPGPAKKRPVRVRALPGSFSREVVLKLVPVRLISCPTSPTELADRPITRDTSTVSARPAQAGPAVRLDRVRHRSKQRSNRLRRARSTSSVPKKPALRRVAAFDASIDWARFWLARDTTQTRAEERETGGAVGGST